jgi:DNA-binding transcriptional ArsR family regulator
MVESLPAQLDDVFAALSDRTRRGMMQRLADGELSVSALADPHDMSLQAVSKHVAVLERAGLACREKRGRTHFVRLTPEPLAPAAGWIRHYQKFWESKLDALAAYLEAEPSPAAGADRESAPPRDRRSNGPAESAARPRRERKEPKSSHTRKRT